MTPVWAIELAARFWSAAGPPPAFPRDLALPAAFALPIRIVSLPALGLDAIRQWLAQLSIPSPVDEPDRLLRACLVSRYGRAFVFLDADDPPDEQRFSLAHEIAHFLRDYDGIRRKATKAFGIEVLEVLDGRRPATRDERIHAMLRSVPVAAHVHLLHRDESGRPRTASEREAEAAADRLAYELLAPAELLAEGDRTAIYQRLIDTFGMPAIPAARYAAILRPEPLPTDPFIERLRKPC